jgi:hypothetical protein
MHRFMQLRSLLGIREHELDERRVRLGTCNP